VSEDARKALAEGFLPVLERVAQVLSDALAKPETLASIRSFGQDLAKGFDKLLDIGTRLPWETIGASMRIAGAGASAILQAFASMPPWVQTAVLTGWGLNKLTGGALGDIVGELSKGLIRGVLGINAGVVNINAGVVNGGGGGGIPPVAGAAAAGIGAPGAATLGAGIGLALAPVLSAYLTQGADTQAIAIREGLGELSAKQVDMFQGLMPQFTALAANAGSQSLAPKLSSLQQQQVVNHATEERQASLLSQITAEERQAITATDNLRNRLATLQQRLHNAKEAGDRTRAAALRAKIEGVKARIATSNAKLEAIRRKKTQFNQKIVVPVTSTVTVRGVVVSRKLWNQYTKSSAGEFW
jgi:hypothetical protein